MRVIVIGGGPSGMAAAYSAAEKGAEVFLIEHNEKLGKKLYITGKGRCNVTNIADRNGFISNIATNPNFLFSVLSEYDSKFVMSFFERHGTPLKIERGGRVFPESDKAVDITKTFERLLQSKVKVLFDIDAAAFKFSGDRIIALETDKGIFEGDSFVVATGGITYRATGSNGSGFTLARQVGHTIIKAKPALCGIKTKKVYPLMGLSLKNIKITCLADGKKYSEFGELLFTHEGISGPCVLTLSSKLNKTDISDAPIFIDLKPALNEETLNARLLRDFAEYANKQYKNALFGLLPQSLVPVFIEISGISGEKKVNEITQKERRKIIGFLKAFPLTAKGFSDIDTAIVTSGGVNVKEINPKTMQSRLMNNLYFAGEVIDVDALTGGFNIHIALATGFTAGKYAAVNGV